MTLISIAIALVVLSISYLFGTIIQRGIYGGDNQIPKTAIGLFSILGLFEFSVFLVVFLKLNSILLLISIFFIIVLCFILIFRGFDNEFFSKSNMLSIIFCLTFTLIFFLAMSGQTQGEKAFDSVHYTSMVMEYSSINKVGGLTAFSGALNDIQTINMNYDYQGFYHFFSVLIKIVRNLFNFENVSLTPIYLNTSAILYFYILAESIYSAVSFFNKRIKYRIVSIAMVLWVTVFFVNYFNISLNFFGNTWKTLVISSIMLSIYIYHKIEKRKIICFLSLLYAALIACSSSGFFISIMIAVGLFFYLVSQKCTDSKVYMCYLISCLPIIIFGIIYTMAMSITVATILFLVCFILFLLILFSKKFSDSQWMFTIKIFKLIFLIALISFIITSYYVSDTMITGVDSNLSGYEFFFRYNSSTDMTLNYFKSRNNNELIRNIIFWIFGFMFILNKRYELKFKKILLIIVVLFINPLVTPFVVKYMTNIVYSRIFEIIVNPFILVLIASCAVSFLNENKGTRYCLSILLSIVSMFLICEVLLNCYSKHFLPTDDYNAVLRTTNSEYELYNEVINEVSKSKIDRPKILSQNIGLKGYVTKVEVLLDANEYRSAPAYSDLEIDAPSEWLNIFYPRDFYGQKVWREEPNFKNTCNAIFESKADYVVIDKTITYVEDDVFLPLKFKVRECSTSIFENENWIFYKVNK